MSTSKISPVNLVKNLKYFSSDRWRQAIKRWKTLDHTPVHATIAMKETLEDTENS